MTEPMVHEITCPFDHANCHAEACDCECHQRMIVTKSGKTLTDDDISALAAEAEMGYNIHDDGTVTKLMDTTDAAVWAREFCRLFDGWHVWADGPDNRPQILTEGTMIGWFANALEVGRSAGMKQGRHEGVLRSWSDDLGDYDDSGAPETPEPGVP